jgi:hypothetical protein
VVTALAVHHLDDAGKRSLYRRVADTLAPGGVFVNAEQVAGPTPELDRRYHEFWLARVAASTASSRSGGLPCSAAGAKRWVLWDDCQSYPWVV